MSRAAPRVLVVEQSDSAPLGRLATLDGLDVVRPHHGDAVPTSADGLDGLIVLGGHMAAWEDDDAPWLPATRRLLVEAVRRETPTLGVCLGAQLLAMACGGTVTRAWDGPEVGVLTVDLTDAGRADVLTGSLPSSFVAPQAHHDTVVELPPGAELLASSAAYRHQAFRLGASAWGVQYHPEATAEVFAGWMAKDVEHLAARGSDPSAAIKEFTAAENELAATARAHAAAFAGVVAARRR